MRELIGRIVIIGGILTGFILAYEKVFDWKGITAFVLLTILGGVVIANLNRISEIGLKGGRDAGMSIKLQQQVEHVDTKALEVEANAAEVKDIKEQVKLLVQNANETNSKIKNSEHNIVVLVETADRAKTSIEVIDQQVKQSEVQVSEMRDEMRQTWRSMFESFLYAMHTRSIFPVPILVAQEINKHLNTIAAFIYPDISERTAEMHRIQKKLIEMCPSLKPPTKS